MLSEELNDTKIEKTINRNIFKSPSLISNFIRNNEDWRNQLSDKGIKVKEDGNLLCFNYEIGCDFSDEIVKEARGIILYKDTLDVACWPFKKFFNSHEPEADKIDWKTARVQEKVDGSIIKLFHNRDTGDWQWATNGMINAKDATIESMFSKNFLDVIQKADNLKDIPFNELDKDTTYIFELIGPENKIVIIYPKTHLYHIGTRNNKTGIETNTDIGIDKPHEYPLHSFDETLSAVKALNQNSEGYAEHEGFVVVDGNWNRIKVKSPEYVTFHHLTNGTLLNKSKILELLNSDDFNIKEVATQFPEYQKVFDFYEKQIENLYNDAEIFIGRVRKLYEQTDRKTVAEKIRTDKFAVIGFNSLGNKKSAKELISEMPKNKYEKLFDDYRDISSK